MVYIRGAVIHSVTTSYNEEFLHSADYSDEKLKSMLENQHRSEIGRIRGGEIKPPAPPATGSSAWSLLLITIQVNGEKKEIPEGLTLAALLEWLKLPNDRVAVEHNLEIVPRNRWRETAVQGGDRLEVVHFVGGGFDLGF